MLRRIGLVLIVLPLSLIAVLLSVANRQPVTLNLDPFGGETIAVAVPLFLLVFASVILGVVLGGVAVWLRQARFRKAARQARREARQAAAQAAELREMMAASAPAPAAARGLPAPGASRVALTDRRSAA
ncbi:lipopolysaccharide assembly protein LapA domain-containing protein [Ancylobacter lacus]|uniref:lipopolysaccharide assembly protein LapA domain-containing protein n=1 Tax=Ancylobacter lacus TaxID=2579970 RepID=UPI0031B84E3A